MFEKVIFNILLCLESVVLLAILPPDKENTLGDSYDLDIWPKLYFIQVIC